MIFWFIFPPFHVSGVLPAVFFLQETQDGNTSTIWAVFVFCFFYICLSIILCGFLLKNQHFNICNVNVLSVEMNRLYTVHIVCTVYINALHLLPIHVFQPSRSSKKVHNFGKRSNSIKRNPNAPVVKSNWLYKQVQEGRPFNLKIMLCLSFCGTKSGWIEDS